MRHFTSLTNSCLLAVAMISFACNQDQETIDPTVDHLDEQLESALMAASGQQSVDYYKLPSGSDYANIPQDKKNPITAEKVKLGKILFHETGLSTNSKMPEGALTYSCASCHHAQAGFQAGLAQGIGEGGMGFGSAGEGRVKNPDYHADSIDVQPVRTPSALNIAYQTNILWNGQFGSTGVNKGTEAQWTAGTPKEVNHLGYEGVETQAIAGLKVHRMVIEESLCEQLEDYKNLFTQVFPGQAVNYETAGLAIAAYERTLLAYEAPFQQWLRGNKQAMSEEEKKGAILFFDKANCFSCHNGPALSAMEFHALGMNDLEGPGIFGKDPNGDGKTGRGGFTKKAEDMYKFKVPQLYNLSNSPFYGHGASFTTIREVIEYKNEAVPENPDVPASKLAEEFKPLFLSNEEIDQLTVFIENALNDRYLERYVPDALPSGSCFPVADTKAKADLGCGK